MTNKDKNEVWEEYLSYDEFTDESPTITISDTTSTMNSEYPTMASGTLSYNYSGNDILSDTSVISPSGTPYIYTVDNTSTISIDPYLNRNVIQTSKGTTIDVDELAEFMDVVKKRLLILAPNFEMHEKYPMLKQLYDEYKAMERLLSGPDGDNDD